MGNSMPYKLQNNVDVQKQIDLVRKDFEDKLKEKDTKYQEEIKRVVSAKESIQKMLDDIKGKQKDSIIDCPTCGEGHVHRMQGVGEGKGEGIGRYKCTGPNCKEEYVLVDPSSDYVCKDCGMPHKRPKSEDISKKVSCPFCHGTKMNTYDWKARFERIKKSREK